MNKITKIYAREILDSRGNPTIEVEMSSANFCARASVPSGASTGKFEALELRDGGKRFHGKGVQKAIDNINKKISPKIKNFELSKQEKFDKFLIALDGTKNKTKLGANTLLGLSLAYAKLSAAAQNIPLHKYFSNILNLTSSDNVRLKLMFNVINGGAHAPGALDIQEYMIIPEVNSIKKSVQIASEIYHSLKAMLKKEFGALATNIGDEGGFVPPMKDNEMPFKILTQVIKKLGYQKYIRFGIDAAASEFYNPKTKKYRFEGKEISAEKLSEFYKKIVKKYPLIYLEDPFEENDFENFKILKVGLGSPKNPKILICGDDLTVTNTSRIKIAIEHNSCDAIIIKPNQIGTIWEAMEAVRLAKKNSWQPVASHRSGETEDTFIADLAWGIAAWGIKAGAPCRGERTAKYNQLLRIEELTS